MKWFHHETNARQDIKIRRLISVYGMAAYGVFWSVLETLGAEHKEESNGNVELSFDKYPLEFLAADFSIDVVKLKEILDMMADLDLISSEHYSRNILCCPKLRNRSDDYFKRVLRGKRTIRTLFGEDSELSRTSFGECSPKDKVKESKVKESRIKEKEIFMAHLASLTNAWNGTSLPKIQTWNDSRKIKLHARLKEEVFASRYLEAVQLLSKSDFALGHASPRNPGEKPWVVSIDWFLENDNNYVKVLEGKYNNRERDPFAKYMTGGKR